MLELHIQEPEVQTGAVAVSWCVSRETIAALHQAGAAKPQLLLIVAPQDDRRPFHDSQYESRFVVPLHDLMTFIEFKKPGPNRVFGVIVWERDDSYTTVRDAFLQRANGMYRNCVLRSDCSWNESSLQRYQETTQDVRVTEMAELSTSLGVDVPAECFAKEPAEWEKAWVNHFFHARAHDQCHFRKRRLFAYTVQPPLMTLIWLVRVLFAAFFLSCGRRGINFTPIIHPLRGDLEDVGHAMKGSVFMPWSSEADDPWYSAMLVPFAPIVWVPILTIAYMVTRGHLLHALKDTGVILAYVSAFFGMAGLGFTYGIPSISKARARAEAERLRRLQDDEEVALLTCNPGKRFMTVADLPANRRTIRLRFLDLKARVCRPFAS